MTDGPTGQPIEALPLDGLPVLDLSGERGEVGAFILARLGADVIRVAGPDETADGDGRADQTFRNLAYNSLKRSIVLDPGDHRDRSRLADLVAGAAVVFDTGPSGRLAAHGLTRGMIEACNPNVVVVAVSPFGADGPRADDPVSELTIGALGGPVRVQGSPDRAPLAFSLPQVWRHAGAEAAVAAMVARARQAKVGGAQFVDVSAQSAMTWTMLNAMEAHEVQGRDMERTGAELHLSMVIPLRHPCRDGHVILAPRAGMAARLVEWMIADGVVDPSWRDERWEEWDARIIDGEPTLVSHDDLCDAVDRLCLRYTKAELLDRGIEIGATIAPVNDLADLLAFPHLDARGFWRSADGGSAPSPTGTSPPGTSPTGATPTGRSSAGEVRSPGPFVTFDGRRIDPKPRDPSSVGFAQPVSDASRPEPTGRAVADGDGDLPFAGLRVADFSWIGVGPISAKCLADHGATVVRVESAHRIDGLRLQPPFADAEAGIDRSNFFGTFNTSKHSLSIDLKTEGGLRVAKRLVGWADVVIDSFTPGAMARLGLGPDAIRAENPSAITVTTSLLGCGSGYSHMAGYGYHAAAIAGFFNLVGWADRPPDGPWLAYTDTIGPRFIIPTMLAALERRARTGKGVHIEAAQLEMALQLLAPELAEFQRTGEMVGPIGNRHRRVVQGVYPCAGDDCWVAVTVQDDDAWAGLRGLLGDPPWAADLHGAEQRLAAHDRIDAAIEAWTSARSEEEAERELKHAGVAAGRVQRSRDLLADPQYAHRSFYRRHDHAVTGLTPYAGHQYRIDGYDHGPRTASPALGQHTFEILTDLLGFDGDEVAEIAVSGALE